MSKIQNAVLGVMKDIATTGIAKLQRNVQQGYTFRGIESAMNELSPLLVKHGITVTPAYTDLSIHERFRGDPKDGRAIRFCTLKGIFRFSAEDGSHVVSECYGEAMDAGDKAVTKAQSIAFRTALFQQFVVPTMAMDPESYLDPDDDDMPIGPEPSRELLEAATNAANAGLDAYRSFWQSSMPDERMALAGRHAELKATAQRVSDGGAANAGQ
ncbi:ERF family protein [Melaminivora alkalimesophila]|uniref:ERF superfamily protein n=1 Tax=Melaminivora alkalimesophila TaxID=1165852 RepID=A0A317RA36_9BURK|nr:ERF family protein [Melaminivora alkalimesophila]PWW43601.1 ERF superfamily protein [Melaminivora alkalimesophila]